MFNINAGASRTIRDPYRVIGWLAASSWIIRMNAGWSRAVGCCGVWNLGAVSPVSAGDTWPTTGKGQSKSTERFVDWARMGKICTFLFCRQFLKQSYSILQIARQIICTSSFSSGTQEWCNTWVHPVESDWDHDNSIASSLRLQDGMIC